MKLLFDALLPRLCCQIDLVARVERSQHLRKMHTHDAAAGTGWRR